MSRVVHFEISVDEADRALKFYSGVFGWSAEKWGGPDEYWLVNTGDGRQPGINGGLYKRHEGMSFTSHVNTIDVPSVDDFIARIWEHGGRIVTDKLPIPGVGYFAYCQDTEGNTFGIMQPDPSVKA
jgi:predicted enzyme related to lactoylglutathione lyase